MAGEPARADSRETVSVAKRRTDSLQSNLGGAFMTRCAADAALENRAVLFARVHWGSLAVAFFLTAVLSLSVHAVMLQVFDVPYPSASISSPLPDVVNYAIASWASLWFFTRMRRAWLGHSPTFHAAILFVLLCGLNETLRGWFMNAYCTTSAHGWLFFALVAPFLGRDWKGRAWGNFCWKRGYWALPLR